MNTFYSRLIFICFLCCITSAGTAASQNSGSAKPTAQATSIQEELLKKTDQLWLKLEITGASVEETRRDQLNYKVEKDIYKEVYSTQMSTVSIIGSALFGIAAILGFLGLKDLNEVKLKYQSALLEFQQQSA